MSVSLQKGQKVSLTKDNGGLSKVVIGLGWDEVEQKKRLLKPSPIDCDAFAFLLKDGKLVAKEDIVYYGNLQHRSGAVCHLGDNLTGAGEGDDEQIIVDLSRIPEGYDKIVLAVNIYACVMRKQHFGMIQNAFIRLVDARNNCEICRYNLTDDYSGMTAMIFGEVYRHNGEWKFNAIGQGTDDTSMKQLSKRYAD